MTTIDYTRLLERLIPEPGGEDKLRLRTGVIAAVNAEGTVSLTLSGVTVTNVPVLNHVMVAVDAVVQVLSYRGSLLVIGSTSGGGKRILSKSSPQNTPTSSTAMQNATDLSFYAEASRVYLIKALLSYDGATGGDIRIAWSVPSGATMERWIRAPQVGITDNQNTSIIMIRRAAATQQIAGAPGGVSSTYTSWEEDVILRMDTTPGTVQLQFGQGTSSGTVTTLKEESTLIVEPVVG